jgi:DNA polymerase-3 subunit gamma/tau
LYQVIARKYRPQTFAELVSQEHVRTTIENAIAQNRIAHGYIFSGQRGTGKTTVARILARCLNCVNGPTTTPCGVCASCVEIAAGNSPDVIEIDAASNRGINEMRELRENVRYRPARDRYKVFIIDEAHQITNEAFNALLKTLEEPPEWVVFVLCTTEAHKIPATIASRCQHFSFRSVSFEEVFALLEKICREEGIEYDAEALSVLVQAGEGSVRDSESALDQAIACCGNRLKAEDVRALLGSYSLQTLGAVTEALAAGDSARMLAIVDELVRNGQHLQHFVRELARYFRNLLVSKIAGENRRLIPGSEQERARLAEVAAGFSEQDLTRYLQLTLDLFRDLQFSLQPRLHLELGLIRLVEAGRLVSIEQALAEMGIGSRGKNPGNTPAGNPVRKSQQSLPGVPPDFSRGGGQKTPGDAQAKTPAPQAATQPTGLKARIAAALHEMGLAFTADAVEGSQMIESGSELKFVTAMPLAMNPAEIEQALARLQAGKFKIKIVEGQPEGVSPESEKRAAEDDETSRRALEHPEVKRFREVFPDSEVRVVRNLKE